MTFLDTNVFVYEIDVRDPVKQRKATSILLDARDSGDYVISAQVLNEFANVAMRKFGKTREETLAFVELFRAIRTVPVAPRLASRRRRGGDRLRRNPDGRPRRRSDLLRRQGL